MKNKVSDTFAKGKERVRWHAASIGEKLLPYVQDIATPVTYWARKFERSFFATTHIARIFRKTLFIAGVFSSVGLAMGSIPLAAFLSSAKAASIVAGITWGREAVTRIFTDKKDTVWKNEIGQEVRGTKIQKQKLTATQTQINRLVDKFNAVSGPTAYQQKKMEKIIHEMKETAKQVTILSAPDDIAKDRYVFAFAKREWKPAPY